MTKTDLTALRERCCCHTGRPVACVVCRAVAEIEELRAAAESGAEPVKYALEGRCECGIMWRVSGSACELKELFCICGRKVSVNRAAVNRPAEPKRDAKDEMLERAKAFMVRTYGAPLDMDAESRDRWYERLGLLVTFISEIAPSAEPGIKPFDFGGKPPPDRQHYGSSVETREPEETMSQTSEQIEKQLRQNAEVLLGPGYRTGGIPDAAIAGALQMAADEIFKLRKIACFVPAATYIAAKKKAGFPDYVRAI